MKDQEPAVVVQSLYKTFRLPHEQHSGIKQAIISIFRSKRGYETQKVLNDVSFEIKRGEFFGIVGRNGSGKSTLLKLLAGIYAPDSGLVQVNGSLTPFIELGVGFNPELTGRENVFMNGALLGFDHAQMEGMYDDIVEFAEIGEFMDQKLKNYSSGMQVRLAFSIAIRAESDILLLDEVLAVGDAVFQRKCYTYFKELKKNNKTVIFVSHDTGALQEYCDKAVLIDKGKMLNCGKIDTILNEYSDLLNEASSEDGVPVQRSSRNAEDKKVFIKSTQVTHPEGRKAFTEKDDITVTVVFKANREVEKPVFGMTMSDAEGVIVFQSNTLWRKTNTFDLQPGKEVSVEWRVPNAFNSGEYTIEPGVASSSGLENYDRLSEAAKFQVVKKQKSHGYINLLHDIVIK